MLTNNKLPLGDNDHFLPSEYPELNASIQLLARQLENEPTIKGDMLLSFVKDHCIASTQVKDFPRLAGLISTGPLPLKEMENLFAAGKKNPVFNQELEEYIRTCLDINLTGVRPDTINTGS